MVNEAWGAHPSYAQGYYDRDNDFYVSWDETSRDPAKLQAYLDEWVYGVSDRTEYLLKQPELVTRLKAWRAMGGAQDYVVAQCHTITRKLFQEAGYGCVNDAKAVAVAQEIRARCRQVLRNPDGYEIWSDY